jgi:hypothetical protein
MLMTDSTVGGRVTSIQVPPKIGYKRLCSHGISLSKHYLRDTIKFNIHVQNP